MLKRKIFKILDGTVKLESIRLPVISKITFNVGMKIACSIVLKQPPLSSQFKKIDTKIYRVQVFVPKDCPYPYQIGMKGTRTIYFQHKSEYTAEEFIVALLASICLSSDHIYYDYYKEL